MLKNGKGDSSLYSEYQIADKKVRGFLPQGALFMPLQLKMKTVTLSCHLLHAKGKNMNDVFKFAMKKSMANYKTRH